MYDISGSAWDFKCTQTAPAPQMLYYDQSALLGGTRGAKHISKCPPSRHAPECRLYTWSIRIKLKLFWKEVGNGILLDTVRLDQIAPELPTTIHVLFWNWIPHSKKSGRDLRYSRGNANLYLGHPKRNCTIQYVCALPTRLSNLNCDQTLYIPRR